PALLALVRRERKAMDAERTALGKVTPDEESPAAAAELMRQAARVPAADRGKYDKLMARLAARGQAQDARASAGSKLGELLRSAEPARRRALLAAALRAALALDAPGAQAEARALEADPQPDLAAAARGEPEPPRPREPLLGDCLPQLPAAAPPAG